MTEKIDEGLEELRADRVVMYKFEKGKTVDSVDFVEHKNVIAIPRTDGGLAVYDGKKLIIYPVNRLYEIVMSGRSMAHALKQTLVFMRDQDKQISQIEDFLEPKQKSL